jgi:osmotically inducible protein OsmC
MAIQSTANAQWTGKLSDGKGTISHGGLDVPFSFHSRMEGGKEASTPEEFLAAALAGCYSMALSADLGKAGFDPQQVQSTATANFSNASGKWTVETIDLEVKARVPGIDNAKFQEIANGTKSGCPVSRALTGVKINVNAQLLS